MRKGSKLVYFEFNRCSRIYFILLSIMLLSQVIGFYVMSKGYMSNVQHYIQAYGFDRSSIQETLGIFSVGQVIQSIWVMGPLFICIVFMFGYTFYIWYRDWYGPNTFVYRLFMLPVERMYIFVGKAMTLLLMVAGIIAFQLFLLYIGKWIIQLNVPIDLRDSLVVKDAILSFNYLTIFFPFTMTSFFTMFGGMLACITIVFTAILFERSFQKKGVLYGIGYVVGSIFLLASPSIVEKILQRSYVYPAEMFWIHVGLFIVVSYVSIRVSVYLLKKKVHV